MANHVIYDRMWESKKLRTCSRDAALAYPWIFLVADDHGRFEYNPRRIWSKVFGNREDVTLDAVVGWLEEYQQRELLVRYHIDGDLAYWTNFKGRKPSERRPSAYPEPWRDRSRGRGRKSADKVAEKRDEGAEERGSGRDKSTPDQEQIKIRSRSRSRAEAEAEGAPPQPDPHVAVLRLEIGPLLEKLATETGRPATEILAEASRTGQGAAFSTLDECDSVSWLQATRSRLVAMCLQVKARAGPPPPDPEEAKAASAAWDTLPALIDAFLTWYADNPEAGETMGRRGYHGQAFGAWPGGRDIPPGPKDAVLKGALKRLKERCS